MAGLGVEAIKIGFKVVDLLDRVKKNNKDAHKIEELIDLVKEVCLDAESLCTDGSTETDPKVISAMRNLRDVLQKAEGEVTRCLNKKKIIKAIKVDKMAKQLGGLSQDIKNAMDVSLHATLSETNKDVKKNMYGLQVLDLKLDDNHDILLAILKEIKKLEQGQNNDTVDKQQQLVWTPDQLRKRQQEDTEWVSQVLGIPFGAASLLLLSSNWDRLQTINGWFEDGERLRQAIGLRLLPSGDVSGPKQEMKCKCNTCLGESKRTMISAGCGHYYCRKCWRKYISKAVSSGMQECLSLRCPDPYCEMPVDQELLRMAAVKDKVRESYADFLLQSYVDHSGGKIKWCPGLNCVNAIELLGGHKQDMVATCDLNHRFCWSCLKEPHGPLSCDAVRLWPDAIGSLKNKKGAMASSHYNQPPLQEMDVLKSSELRNLAHDLGITNVADLKFLLKADEEVGKLRKEIADLYSYLYEYLGQKHEGDKCELFDLLRDEAYESLHRLQLLAKQEMFKFYDNRVEIDASIKERRAFTKACKDSKTKVMDATKDARDKVDNLVKAVESDFQVYFPE